MLRSLTGKELTFWEAYEEVEGPIGYGPMLRSIAWLGWLQCDKIEPDEVLSGLEAFVLNPEPVQDIEPELTQEQAQNRVLNKLTAMFPQE